MGCAAILVVPIRANSNRTCVWESDDSIGRSWHGQRVRTVVANCCVTPNPDTTMWNLSLNRFEPFSSNRNRSLERNCGYEFWLTRNFSVLAITISYVWHSQRALGNICRQDNFAYIWINIPINVVLVVHTDHRMQQQNFPLDHLTSPEIGYLFLNFVMTHESAQRQRSKITYGLL